MPITKGITVKGRRHHASPMERKPKIKSIIPMAIAAPIHTRPISALLLGGGCCG